jgi:hypothetical protein
MVNIQLIDSDEGGYFAFERNDYPLDQGIYSELFAALFATESAEWLFDNAFESVDYKITSKTGIALKTNSSITATNLALIKKAVIDDTKRFSNKNPDIEVDNIEVAYWSKTILIIIELKGFTDAFNFIYQKTKEVLENYNFKTF